MNERAGATANVFKNGELAATLELRDSATEFSYQAGYLASGKPAVASTLPLTADPLSVAPRRAVPAFFAGLLPEGRRLTALRQAAKISADDEFSLLLAIGSDAIGDVQVLPPGIDPAQSQPVEPLQSGDDLDFEQLAGLTTRDRVGLPGVQDKLSGGMISVPVARADRAYILKLNPPEFSHVVENEAYFLALAKRCGLKAAEAEIVHDRDKRSALLVTRFDRVASGDGFDRLAMEDGCQVLGLWPADKYDVTSEQAIAALSAQCTAPPVARLELFGQWLFALLTGNGDLHAKNVSMLTSDSITRVSPIYDAPSTVFYGDDTLALTALGKRSSFSRRQVLEFASAIELPERAAKAMIERIVDGTEPMIDELSSGALPFEGRQRADAIRQLEHRRKLITG